MKTTLMFHTRIWSNVDGIDDDIHVDVVVIVVDGQILVVGRNTHVLTGVLA
jgi:hypothetical protein